MCVCLSLCVCVCVYANFQAKQRALTFSDQISQKMDLGLGIQKANVGIRIIILEILCQLYGKTKNFDLFSIILQAHKTQLQHKVGSAQKSIV